MFDLLLKATLETVYMVFVSGIAALLFGTPLGMLLYASRTNTLWHAPLFHQSLSMLVNVIRSFPFFILMISLMPFTAWIVGTSIGTHAAMVPLSVAAIPFFARLVENALAELSPGLIEAALSMGANTGQILRWVLLNEAFPSITNAWVVTLITLVGYSAMAGAVGGGGLGSMAFNYGYQRFDTGVMITTVVLLILLVQLIQWLGDRIVQAQLKRIR